MLLKINSNRGNLEVHDCPLPTEFQNLEEKPDTMLISINYAYGYDESIYTMTINYENNAGTKFPHKYSEGQDPVTIGKFVEYPGNMSVRELLEVRRILGFIPFNSTWDGKRWYCESLDFKTVEEFNARKQPIKMGTFLGIPLPQAFIDGICFTELQIAVLTYKLPCNVVINDYAVPNISDIVKTLNKISNSERGLRDVGVEDAEVFRFLGLSHLLGHPFYIANNNISMDYPLNDRILHGDLEPQQWCFTIDLAGVDWSTVPDFVIRMSEEYKKICRAHEDGNNSAKIYAAKLFIKDHKL
jgi:hypothetical protein